MKINTKRHKESGAVLLVTLFVTVALFFSGMLILDISILRETQVGNEQRSTEMFLITKSELDRQFDFLGKNQDNFESAIEADQILTAFGHSPTCSSHGSICQSVELKYLSEQAPPAGYSIDSFTGFAYELDAEATQQGTNASSRQIQGIVIVNGVSK
ncbi:hypothetical protein [uncultured Endozoicomonas sp.]|uniref:hypothetical protein n=1 Tax=uncultured Endozoicomonas sp. TaxID=432652 RepID=UPI00260570FA|nr:hypothetical protein [uncultured Endozoicomonas sp.]